MEPFFGRLGEHVPAVAPDVFVAPGAVIVGQVTVGAGSSVWYGCVLRADSERVTVGEEVNVQDGAVVHADPGFPAEIGDRASVGHRAIVHGARVAPDSLVGMGSVMLNGSSLGSGSVVAAGALVPPGMEIPPGKLAAGVPARVVRSVRESDRAMIHATHENYLRRSALHAAAERLDRDRLPQRPGT
ncbi:Carbonic anhydrases/acetyltransferases isoleucine patch superfamily [Rubrobacter radiotolerans]|uniref:Carbonic anhydrases/acetyltransferases isoleucine patch superfamily n=1 Tax=Rubrobacter radiotolerans TaxID=42256 RepID=A0A023X019_RUBRA|nr:gamma carbonic anhydrase family protein [Rubrobacter radiotolerans]AHY45365.1 Carbonic anhydrases/acetyltransferases isoleucine patch superfamily [Rubrobacter radiotolerans]MDX5892776.1 gamma carbonic anhydrase family protein [Rubrobacter radiotolerans]SMC02475.1 Carbonic anhydrase or acetyltransferase, isoleucine patch superfamily [Rubrobacter radiotolerans DSM 5868]